MEATTATGVVVANAPDDHDAPVECASPLVISVRDRSGAMTDRVLGPLVPTSAARVALVVTKEGRDATAPLHTPKTLPNVPVITSRGEHVYKGFHSKCQCHSQPA